MKILDKYIIKSFLAPFFATFLVVLFVLVMQALWQQFDKIAGKGLGINVILKFLNYTALMVLPTALSIGILLSSIMALGNLSENYEFAAIKSAGVSLIRLLRPLIILMVVLSGLNFMFLNYVFPYASYESKNLLINMKKKQPALALVAGSFNTDIPGFSIKFSEKYGEEKNLLKDVLIYDLTDKKYNNKVITAKHGEISTIEGSKYMTLTLKDGYYHEDIISRKTKVLKDDTMPFIKSHFEEHQINFNIGDLDELKEDKKYDQLKEMLSLNQIKGKVIEMRKPYEKQIKSKTEVFYKKSNANLLYKDTVINKDINLVVLENFNDKNKVAILKKVERRLSRVDVEFKNFRKNLNYKKKNINKYNVEYHERIAMAFSCLVLFFIGAPLGSIIKKGGFGVPMISAILIFVIYFFIGVLATGMAESGKISVFLGGWLSTFIMLPLGLLLIYKAVKDKSIFNLDAITIPIGNFFKIIFKSKKSNLIT